jgi:hypothetical protein
VKQNIEAIDPVIAICSINSVRGNIIACVSEEFSVLLTAKKCDKIALGVAKSRTSLEWDRKKLEKAVKPVILAVRFPSAPMM